MSVETEEGPELLHVSPSWEPGHITTFYEELGPCWCGALPDKECPTVIVHNEGRIQ